MSKERKGRAEEKGQEPAESTPTWVKVAAGVVGVTSACLFVNQMLRSRRPVKVQVPLQPTRSTVTFAEVGGHEDLKRQIERRIITPFREPSLYARFRKRTGGGILMYGPPGCGKTLLARATAGQCNATFFNVAVSDVLDMWLGESERKLAEIFARARAAAPAVLFFDELDGLAARQHRESTHSGIVSQFLAELDGFAGKNSGVLILGATNIPWAIDPAFRRPGRFDRVLFVPPPDRAARAAILRIQMAGRPAAQDVDLDWIAGQTVGYSGADLELLVEEAVDAAIQASIGTRVDVPIGAEHLRAALGQVRPTTHEWFSMTKDEAHRANASGKYDEALRFLEGHEMNSQASNGANDQRRDYGQ